MNGFEYCRRRAGMTQIEAAAAIGVSQGAVSSWENGNAYPKGDRLLTVAKVYACNIAELFEKKETA